MKIEKYILDLLKKQECVIIPGFGAFITQAVSATHNPSDNKFFPPAKQVSFNRLLSKNDGLLIQSIATNNGITYNDAQSQVATQVAAWNFALENNETILIKHIGKLYKQYDAKINFIPDLTQNLEIQSYGLNATKHIPIDRAIEKSTTLRNPINQQVEIKKSNNKKLEVNRKNKNRKRKFTYAIAACIITAIAFTQLFFFANAPLQLNEASFISFINVPSLTKPNTIYKVLQPHICILPFALEVEKNAQDNNTIITSSNTINSAKLQSNNLLNNNYSTIKTPTAGYYIVLGCFKEPKNANKLYNKIIHDGNFAVKKMNANGTTTVAQFASENEAKAKNILQEKKLSQADAWLKWFN